MDNAPFSLVKRRDVNIVFYFTVRIMNNFVIDWQMSNNANNLFERHHTLVKGQKT
jgi:hypothetical protein